MAKQTNWNKFERKLKEKRLLLFSAVDVVRVLGVSSTAATFLVHRYTKKGFLLRMKRGLYAFPDAPPSDLFLANKLCEPSYVSLEFALSYHGVIPETVYEITSVTTKTTRRLTAAGKAFTYRRIKRAAFTGYSVQHTHGSSYQIADPEKAFVDACYLRMRSHAAPLRRFRKDKLHAAKAMQYAKLFGNEALVGLVVQALREHV